MSFYHEVLELPTELEKNRILTLGKGGFFIFFIFFFLNSVCFPCIGFRTNY